MENRIISKNNKIISFIKSLHNKKYRDKNNQFFIEGYRFVKDAIENSADFECIIIDEEKECKDFIDLNRVFKEKNIQVYYVPRNLFNEICDTQNPQGILAVINKRESKLESVLDQSKFLILLENVQDPGNMGTIIRTADAAGVDAVILSSGCADIYNPKVLRSTMGSIFHIPIIKVDEFVSVVDILKNNKFNIYGAHPYGAMQCYDVNMKQKTGIIIGNEGNGLSDTILDKCTQLKIPMLGKAESLNASVAATILIYERVRQNL